MNNQKTVYYNTDFTGRKLVLKNYERFKASDKHEGFHDQRQPVYMSKSPYVFLSGSIDNPIPASDKGACSKFCHPSMLAKYGVSVSVWVWYGVGAWVWGC